jgi:hypothetical protein
MKLINKYKHSLSSLKVFKECRWSTHSSALSNGSIPLESIFEPVDFYQWNTHLGYIKQRKKG